MLKWVAYFVCMWIIQNLIKKTYNIKTYSKYKPSRTKTPPQIPLTYDKKVRGMGVSQSKNLSNWEIANININKNCETC